MKRRSERRSGPRIPTETLVRVRRGADVYLGQAIDLSDGGFGLALSSALPEGTEVDLSWCWRDQELQADGVVRSSTAGGMGIAFRHLPRNAERAIAGLIDQSLLSWG